MIYSASAAWLLAVAIGCAAFAGLYFLHPRDVRPVTIDPKRDACVSTNSLERYIFGDIGGALEQSRFLGTDVKTPDQQAWLARIRERIELHNAVHKDGRYVIAASPPHRLRGQRFMVMANGVICKHDNLSNCRNRTFFFVKEMPPDQFADLVFESTIKGVPAFPRCRTANPT